MELSCHTAGRVVIAGWWSRIGRATAQAGDLKSHGHGADLAVDGGEGGRLALDVGPRDGGQR